MILAYQGLHVSVQIIVVEGMPKRTTIACTGTTVVVSFRTNCYLRRKLRTGSLYKWTFGAQANAVFAQLLVPGTLMPFDSRKPAMALLQLPSSLPTRDIRSSFKSGVAPLGSSGVGVSLPLLSLR